MRIKTLITSLCVFLFTTASAFAAQGQNADQQKIDNISSQTQSMQQQLTELRHEVAQLKNQQHLKSHSHAAREHEQRLHAQNGTSMNLSPEARTQQDMLIQTYMQSLPLDWDNPGQSFVAIGPYVNVPVQFNGMQLIINDPKINTDVALLKLRKAAHEGMVKRGVHTEDETHHSHLLLSGFLEAQGQYIRRGQQNGNLGSGNNGSSSNVDLSAAELDGFLLTPSPWVSGFFSFSYYNGSEPVDSNSRVLNSRLFLNNAFIMLGDFSRSPFYGTAGQMFVPFGTYATVLVSAPLTKIMARTKARAALVGYQGQSPDTFYTALYAFKGDSHASATSRINNGGINLGYRFDIDCPDISGDIGMGWIANIADSVGMQYTSNQPKFNGFGGPVPYGNEKIVHRVPALDFRGLVTIGTHLNLIAEYVGVTTTFNPNDLSFNSQGANPWAVDTEASYTFKVFDKASAVAVAYGQAHEALALGLPERRVSMVLNTSIWHNTVQSLEFRHDINYSGSTVATGSNVLPQNTGLGTSDNVVTLQFDLYF